MTPTADWSSEDGAFALARKITAYWAERGVQVSTRIERLGDVQKMGKPIFTVRSNLHEVRHGPTN